MVTRNPTVVTTLGDTPLRTNTSRMGVRSRVPCSRKSLGSLNMRRASGSQDDAALLSRLDPLGDLLVHPQHQPVEVALRGGQRLVAGHHLHLAHQPLVLLLLLL